MEEKKLCFLVISTYRKPDALRVMLQSLFDHGYDKVSKILVTDDFNNGIIEELGYSAGDVVKEFPGVAFSYGPRLGVWANKNRGIQAYLEDKDELTYLLLMDDDQRFIRPGLIEELIEICEKNDINHVSGKWTDFDGVEKPQLTGEGWSKTFPVVAQGFRVTWHSMGCHGNANFYTRKCIKRIGYYPKFPKPYGYEHAIHSSMAMKVCDKRTPYWYPQHTRGHRYYLGQNIPNRYSLTPCIVKLLNQATGLLEDRQTTEEVRDNDVVYNKYMNEIAAGLLRKNKESGL